MTMAMIRRWHFYIGMFIAPSVLFFALTGAVQLFSLHEARGDYVPSPIIEKLSSVHKDQAFVLGRRPSGPRPAPSASSPDRPLPDRDNGGRQSPLPLKVFFLVVALGLASSTIMGLWIGLTRAARRRTGWGLVLAGVILPMVLLLI